MAPPQQKRRRLSNQRSSKSVQPTTTHKDRISEMQQRKLELQVQVLEQQLEEGDLRIQKLRVELYAACQNASVPIPVNVAMGLGFSVEPTPNEGN
ncbi:MAG: hypothetical protein GY820_02540 [Gammaproteobacteria bacterium]|nr:hypothetical protein [Gammaproteobacteria bacterium]